MKLSLRELHKFENDMSEMLGNQYFMARNYSAAQKEFEEVLLKQPEYLTAKKKLIICYTQSGNITKAFDYFFEIVKTDINCITKTDPIKDDCPCPELIENLEPKHYSNTDSFEYNLIMGMLWLYCEAKESSLYFEKLLKLQPENQQIIFVANKIAEHLNQPA